MNHETTDIYWDKNPCTIWMTNGDGKKLTNYLVYIVLLGPLLWGRGWRPYTGVFIINLWASLWLLQYMGESRFTYTNNHTQTMTFSLTNHNGGSHCAHYSEHIRRKISMLVNQHQVTSPWTNLDKIQNKLIGFIILLWQYMQSFALKWYHKLTPGIKLAKIRHLFNLRTYFVLR